MTEKQSSDSELGSELAPDEASLLLVRYAAGETEAFADFMSLYKNRVYTYLNRSKLSETSRDDLFQEIFVKIHRNAHKYNPDKPLTPWVFTITINTIRNHFRRETVRRFFEFSQAKKSEERTTTQQHDSRELLEWLSQQIGTLPKKQREVISLHCVKGLEQSEVAQVLGIPANSVKTLLRRARITLAKKLAARKAQIEHEVSK